MIDWINDRAVSEIVSALAWTHLHFLWQGCIIAALYAALARGMRRSIPQSRYLLGCAALLVMAVAPLVTFAILRSTGQHPHPATTAAPLALGPHAAVQPAPADVALMLVAGAWCIGTLIASTWLAGGWIETLALRRANTLQLPARTRAIVDHLADVMHVRAAVRLVDCARVKAPMTIGWIAPVILLPASTLGGLSSAQLKAVIAHEFAHVRRWDYLVNMLQRLVESALFYHPAVWWISARVRQDREYCCDDIAAAVCGDPVLYAQALAELETIRSLPHQLALSSQGGSLMNRITRLLDIPQPRPARSHRSLAALVVLAALTAASATFAVAHRPQQSDDRSSAQEATDATAVILQEAMVTASDEHVLHVGALLKTTPALRVLGKGNVTLLQVDAQPTFEGTLKTLDVPKPAEPLMVHLLVKQRAHVDPIERLIEAEQLNYPWDIFDIMLGPDPASDYVHIAERYDHLAEHYGRLAVSKAITHEIRLVPSLEESTLKLELVDPILETEANLHLEPTVAILTELVLLRGSDSPAARENADEIIEEVVNEILEEESP